LFLLALALWTSTTQGLKITKNKNNNNNAKIYRCFGTGRAIARVHPVYLMNNAKRQAAANPQTKPIDLGCESVGGYWPVKVLLQRSQRFREPL